MNGGTQEAYAATLRAILHRGIGPYAERCGGPRRILGAVTAPHAVRRVLAALGLAAEPPPGRPVPHLTRPHALPIPTATPRGPHPRLPTEPQGRSGHTFPPWEVLAMKHGAVR
jgi:hypothetical protein